MVTPPSPFYEVPMIGTLSICLPIHFSSEKKMILKCVWRVLKVVLRVLQGCCKEFEGYLEKWNRGMKSVRPPPFAKWFHKKSFFHNWWLPLDVSWIAWPYLTITRPDQIFSNEPKHMAGATIPSYGDIIILTSASLLVGFSLVSAQLAAVLGKWLHLLNSRWLSGNQNKSWK